MQHLGEIAADLGVTVQRLIHALRDPAAPKPVFVGTHRHLRRRWYDGEAVKRWFTEVRLQDPLEARRTYHREYFARRYRA